VRACVLACVRACVRVYVRTYVRACVRVCMCVRVDRTQYYMSFLKDTTSFVSLSLLLSWNFSVFSCSWNCRREHLPSRTRTPTCTRTCTTHAHAHVLGNHDVIYTHSQTYICIHIYTYICCRCCSEYFALCIWNTPQKKCTRGTHLRQRATHFCMWTLTHMHSLHVLFLRTHTCSHTIHTHTCLRTLTHTYTHTCTHTHTHTHTHAHKTRTHTKTHTNTHSHTHTHTHTHAQSCTLSSPLVPPLSLPSSACVQGFRFRGLG